ncbi:hypothetical protein, partial [Escherichia coli]|uniref:hypothetical protein n=1 Tax=Escherichia coli TaxID=562 RepID=UPI003F667DB6
RGNMKTISKTSKINNIKQKHRKKEICSQPVQKKSCFTSHYSYSYPPVPPESDVKTFPAQSLSITAGVISVMTER